MWAVLSDFDGTIAEEDLAELALARFAEPRWERFNNLLAEGKIDVEECVARQYDMIRVKSRAEITSYLRSLTTLRHGLEELLLECESGNTPFAIVSAGLDFIIRDTFRTSDILMPRLICPRSYLIPGKGFGLVFPKRKFAISRDFKEDSVLSYKKRGYQVLYVGDGTGDTNAAAKSDRVFTIRSSMLDEMCRARRIPHTNTESFDSVTKFLATHK